MIGNRLSTTTASRAQPCSCWLGQPASALVRATATRRTISTAGTRRTATFADQGQRVSPNRNSVLGERSCLPPPSRTFRKSFAIAILSGMKYTGLQQCLSDLAHDHELRLTPRRTAGSWLVQDLFSAMPAHNGFIGVIAVGQAAPRARARNRRSARIATS